MAKALVVRGDFATSEQLRAQADLATRARTRLRLLAIADLLDGRARADISDKLGLNRQALHDAVRNFNRDGPAGLINRPRGHRKPTLTEAERASLAAYVQARIETTGSTKVPVKDLRAFVEQRHGKVVHPWTVSRFLRSNPPREPQGVREADADARTVDLSQDADPPW